MKVVISVIFLESAEETMMDEMSQHGAALNSSSLRGKCSQAMTAEQRPVDRTSQDSAALQLK